MLFIKHPQAIQLLSDDDNDDYMCE